MKTKSIALGLFVAGSLMAADAGERSSPDTVRVFYYGNSLTGSTAPHLHTPLGETAGKQWVHDAMMCAGGQVWQFMRRFQTGLGLEPVDDYTLDEMYAAQGKKGVSEFLKNDWDAIVIQPFMTYMVEVCSEKWSFTFEREIDVGDLAASKYLIDLLLKKNPKGRVLIYQDWPNMPDYFLMQKQTGLRKHKLELSHDQMHYIRRSFDWEKEWKRPYNPDEPPHDCAANSQSYEWLLMEELKEAYPQLWEEGRLALIPVGDVYNILHRKALTDRIPGLYSAGQFYCDGLHNRGGMPAYTCAASFYAMLFNAHPKDLDPAVYNNQESYGSDDSNDHGVILEITPERADIIHDTIWEILQVHPYTRMSDKNSVDAYRKLEASIPAPEIKRVALAFDDSFFSWLPAWQMHFSRSGGQWLSITSQQSKGSLRELLEDVERKPEQYRHNLMDPWCDVLCLTPGNVDDTELNAAVTLAKQYLEKRPDGQLAFFFGWPTRKGNPAPFDFSAAWKAPDINNAMAAGMKAFMAGIHDAFPDMKDRITVLPVGEVLAELDAKLKSGALPGTASMADLYKDDHTLRTGLPRYAVAATAHAALTGGDPAQLDGEIYNETKYYAPDFVDPKNTKLKRSKAYGPVIKTKDFDNGPHFSITPEGKKLVDDAIREVVLLDR